MLTCRRCGSSFSKPNRRGRDPYYCSDPCRNRRTPYGQRRGPQDLVCAHCGVQFVFAAAGGPVAKYCSRVCRQREFITAAQREQRSWLHYPRSSVSINDCESCGAIFVARTKAAMTCSDACRRVRAARLQRERYDADRDAAAQRVRDDRAAWTAERRAAERERQRAWRREVGYLDCMREADQRRRARLLKAEVERFANTDVFERDCWRCGICNKRVRQDLLFPHPFSASLDHVVPLSLGGAHVRANVRLAHLRCNVARGSRMGAEQLALIG